MDTDRYGRVVGLVQHGDVDVNAALLDAGQAWVYPQYCRAVIPCAEWVVVTIRAALAQRGLWAAGMPQPPWDWRRERRAARADAESCKSPRCGGFRASEWFRLLRDRIGLHDRGLNRG